MIYAKESNLFKESTGNLVSLALTALIISNWKQRQDSLRTILNLVPQIHFIHIADLATIWHSIHLSHPDLVLFDNWFNGTGIFQIIPILRPDYPRTKFVVIGPKSTRAEESQTSEADLLLDNDFPPEKIQAKITHLLQTIRYVPPKNS